MSTLPLAAHTALKQRLKDLRITRRRLAALIDVSPASIYTLVSGRKRLSAELAIALERAGLMSARFWLMLQMEHDIALAKIRKS